MMLIMPALPKIEGHVWIGPKPTTFDDVSDKVVLVVFWTYSSMNCRRIIPHVESWHEKYQDEGLAIIGVHAPEFEFESDPKNVENAVRELGITWPVLLDNDLINWDNFENDSWPAFYLSDKEGNVVYFHSGEGEYEETEAKIRELLDIQGVGSSGVEAGSHTHEQACVVATPEAYCGYLRGKIGNDLGYAEESEDFYTVPEEPREGDVVLEGAFFSSSEYVESREEGAALSISFYGREVNLVLAAGKDGAEAEVLFDGAPLDEEKKGKDVGEKSVVEIRRPGMYNLFKSEEAVSGTIKLRAVSGNFRAYIFTFSGCNR